MAPSTDVVALTAARGAPIEPAIHNAALAAQDRASPPGAVGARIESCRQLSRDRSPIALDGRPDDTLHVLLEKVALGREL